MEIIDAIERLTDPEEIRHVFHAAISRLGFEHFVIAGLPDKTSDVPRLMLLSDFPREWFERYVAGDYLRIDPVARHSRTTALPFAWSEVPLDRDHDHDGLRVMNEAREYGLVSGFAVPIHLEGATQAIVSLAGNTGPVDTHTRRMLHLLSFYTHAHLRRLKLEVGPAGRAPRRAITPREAEVLKWAATGRTAEEIAAVTGLTARTVHQHCINAQSKLGTRNRTQTVVEAIRNKLIEL